MTICNDLRQVVLQAAIQGKLTQQMPEDGSVADLLKEIKAEKEALIKDKRTKREKPLVRISEDEIPFDIPEHWMWIRLPDVSVSDLGKTMDKGKNTGALRPYLCSINVYWSGINLEKIKEAKFEDSELEKYSLKKGDLLICEGGDVGRAAIWDFDCPMYYQNALHRIRFFGNINPYYFRYIFRLYKYNGTLDDASKGMTIKHLVQTSLNHLVFPLPPLAEQQRIVARVDELMAQIDDLEKTENELVALKKAFPGDMKAALLQAAMQGKLTEQLLEDGSAAELLAKIKSEKERLIKEKKIKKEKALEPISEDEIPFDIPDNWVDLRAGFIFTLFDGQKVNDVHLPNLDAKFLRGKDDVTVMTAGKYVHAGDKMILVDGENSGEVFVAPVDGIQGSTFKLLYISDSINAAYAQYFLLFYRDHLRKNKKGAAIPHLNKDVFANLIFPLPPLAEQQRIVEKLDKLLPLCDAFFKKGP